MDAPSAGYREREHTADWELEVWAPDFVTLLEQAARGMYALSGVQLRAAPRRTRSIKLEAADLEGLLVAFLDELLFLGEQEDLAFDVFDLILEGNNLRGELTGAPIAACTKEIKAVTYHNLEIRKGARGLEVRIVFDV